MSEGRGQYSRTELEHGLTVLTESMSGVRSASVGVWIRFGSAHESLEEMGIAHLLEHMVFKATARRSARDIALSLERLGGSLDAYTTREHTSFQARVLDEHLDVALDVLADLVVHPTLRAEDLELEREVILEEISTVEDTPDDLIFELQSEALWNGHPYGHSILGTRDTVSRLTAADLQRVHGAVYGRPNIVIAGAGHVAHEAFVARVDGLFAEAPGGGAAPVVAPVATEPLPVIRQQRDTAQTHIVLGMRTFGHADPRRYAFVLLSNAMGGGMSSRLFQRVREELGLAYSVYSFQSFYQDAGVSGVYVGTRPEWGDRALDVIREEMAQVARTGLDEEELQDAKGQVKGQLALSLESSGGRMHRLAAFELYDEPFQDLDELTARVDAVTLEDIAGVAKDYWDPDRHTLVRLGPDAG